MAKVIITDGIIDEMTLVGDGFAPRNPKAKALSVKSAAVQAPVTLAAETPVEYQVFAVDGTDYLVAADAPSFVEAVIKATPSTAKAFVTQGYLVPSKVKDSISGAAGDASDKYETAAGHITNAHYDLSQASGISDKDARSHAVKHVVDSHIANMNAMQAGKDGKDDDGKTGKAGRKLSQGTLDKITAIQGQIKAATDQLDSLMNEDTATEETTEETVEEKAMKNVTPPAVETPAEKEAVVEKAAIDLEAIVAAVKAGIVIPDNSKEFAELTSQLSALSNRIEVVEGTTTVTAAKAAANDATLKAAFVSATEPLAVGGIATLMEDGKTYAAPAAGGEASQKAAPVAEITQETSAMDAVLALQRAGRARGNKR